MQPLGEFIHISGTGTLIFRGKSYPPMSSNVITKTGIIIGKVVDVIGPVSYPYFVIRPEIKLTERLVSEIKSYGLFILKDKRRSSAGRNES